MIRFKEFIGMDQRSTFGLQQEARRINALLATKNIESIEKKISSSNDIDTKINLLAKQINIISRLFVIDAFSNREK